ncbi:hypothetical protein RCL1_007624 [Eukaryota sp. TZLM3-RCL]
MSSSPRTRRSENLSVDSYPPSKLIKTEPNLAAVVNSSIDGDVSQNEDQAFVKTQSKAFPFETAYIKHNLVRQVFESLFPTTTLSASWDDVRFIWKDTNTRFDQYSRIERVNGLFNHFENNSILTTKSGLLKTLTSINALGVMPFTVFFYPPQRLREVEDFVYNLREGQYITKPPAGCKGSGIKIFQTRRDLCSFLTRFNRNSGLIVQSYIKRPKLYNGRKFDMRVLVLVDQNFNVHIYRKIYARVCSQDYCSSTAESQITNIQLAATRVPLQTIATVLKLTEDRDFFGPISSMVMRIFTDPFVLEKFSDRRRNCFFELFGCDFIMDDSNEIYLLEINQNPAISEDTDEVSVDIFHNMVKELLQIVLPVERTLNHFQRLGPRNGRR